MMKLSQYLILVGALFVLQPLVGFAAEDKPVEPELLIRASSYCKAGEFLKAEASMLEFVNQQPNHAKVCRTLKDLGNLYYYTGQIKKIDTVLETMGKFYLNDPEMPKMALQLSNDLTYHACHHKSNLINEFLIKKFPRTKHARGAYNRMIRNYIELRDEATAKKYYDLLLKEFSDDPTLSHDIYNIGWHYNWFGKPDKTVEILRSLIKQYPSHERMDLVYRDLVKSYLQLGQTAKAEAAVKECAAVMGAVKPARSAEVMSVQNMPSVPYRVLADQFYDVGKFGKAAELYRQAGTAGQGQGRMAVADASVSNVSIDLVLNQAKCYIAMKNTEAAKKVVQSLIGSYSGNERLGEILYIVGRQYRKFGFSQEAQEMFEYVSANCAGKPNAFHAELELLWDRVKDAGDARDASLSSALSDINTRYKLKRTEADILDDLLHFNFEDGQYDRCLAISRQLTSSKCAAHIHKYSILYAIKAHSMTGQHDEMLKAVKNLISLYNEGDGWSLVYTLYHEVFNGYVKKSLFAEDKAEGEYCRNILAIMDVMEQEIGSCKRGAAGEHVLWTELLLTRADCFYRLREHKNALKCLYYILETHPNTIWAWRVNSEIVQNYQKLLKKGQVKQFAAEAEIRAAYKRILAKSPTNVFAPIAKAWLKANPEK